VEKGLEIPAQGFFRELTNPTAHSTAETNRPERTHTTFDPIPGCCESMDPLLQELIEIALCVEFRVKPGSEFIELEVMTLRPKVLK
jgi:hypothetical protein